VERSSIKQDLHRRDFTINTLAISLDEESYGELLDFYGGEKDIEQGLIRVLHNLSFVEDPTRILRAIRLEQRLGFRVEERTEELIHDALDLLHRVSGERIYQELEAIFREEQPTKALERLQSLEVLSHIHPALHYDDKIGEKIKALPQGLKEWRALACRSEDQPEGAEPILYLALLAYEAESQGMESLISRLKPKAKEARILRQVAQLRTLVPQLSKKGLSRSGLYRLLRPYSSQAIFLLWLTAKTKPLKKRLELYHHKLACVEPLLDGQDLKRLGVPPGPIYGQILETLRDARLEGKVRSRKGEERLVREFLAAKR
jgi:tRNA nucleotidyltransferase (CCA-adding enzyme)